MLHRPFRLTLAALLAGASLGASAHELYSDAERHLNANVEAVFGAFHSERSYAIARDQPGSTSWREGYIKYGLSADQALGSVGSLYGAFAMLAALRHRDRTGEGSEVRLPLGDVAIGTMANAGLMAEVLYRGSDRERLGNAIWGAFGRDFRAKDGVRFMVAALTPKQWTGLVKAFGLEAGIAALEAECGVRFADGDTPRFQHRAALFALFQSAADGMDYAELEARMAAEGCTFERYRTAYEAANDPVLVAGNPLFGPAPANPSGFDYPATRSFANLPGQEAGDPAPAPYLGEHSEEVLSEKLGLSSGAIGKLVDAGTVALSDKDR